MPTLPSKAAPKAKAVVPTTTGRPASPGKSASAKLAAPPVGANLGTARQGVPPPRANMGSSLPGEAIRPRSSASTIEALKRMAQNRLRRG